MANAGYIFVKSGKDDKEGAKEKPQGYRAFFGPHDVGSAKPSFCYPKQKEALVEEIRGMEKALSDGYVGESRVQKVKQELRMKQKRLDGINEQETAAKSLFKKNADACMKRRDELAETIAAGLPSAKDVNKRRVNPQRLFQQEKQKGFGEIKREFQILSHLAGEESNTAFLQKD